MVPCRRKENIMKTRYSGKSFKDSSTMKKIKTFFFRKNKKIKLMKIITLTKT